MQKGKNLHFNCRYCSNEVHFSIFNLEESDYSVECESCSKKYLFSDEILVRQLKKFDALLRQIHESEEILSMTSVGIDVGLHDADHLHSVKIPFRLLLTRLNSSLELQMGGVPLTISFRIEPAKDVSMSINN